MSRLNSNKSSITDLVGVMPRLKLDGGTVPVWPMYELGAETFRAGEMVCLSGSNGSQIGVTRPGTDASGYGIVGFAADNASGFTSSIIGVFPVVQDVVWTGNVGHSVTSANAQTAATDLYQAYGLTSLSGRTYVDKNKGGANTSTAMCRIIGFYDQDVVPTFYGRVYFQVLENKRQLNLNLAVNVSSTIATVV